MAYPSVIASLTDPLATQPLSAPSHSSIHSAVNHEVIAIETFLGTTNTSTLGTLIYDVRSPLSGGGGHVQTAQFGGTGQTVFNKGDLLVGQSSSVLTKLSVSSVNGYGLFVNSSSPVGVGWAPTAAFNYQVFAPSVGGSSVVGTWTAPTGLSGQEMVVIFVAGGGGGGGGASTVNSGTGGGGGGGGGVAYAVVASSILLGKSVSVIAGQSGAGNVAANNNNVLASVGGSTYFGSILSVSGGNGGNNVAGAGAAGNGGGGGGVNYATIPVMSWFNGQSGSVGGSLGGGFGGGAAGPFSNTTKQGNGLNPGDGGGGGGSGGTGGTGGTGAPGVVQVWVI